jgi:hypothetical protein
MRPVVRDRVEAAFVGGIGLLAGLILAVVVTLNLHIAAGLEQGYAATPSQVFGHSPLLGLFDLALLLGAPTLGVFLMLRLRRP